MLHGNLVMHPLTQPLIALRSINVVNSRAFVRKYSPSLAVGKLSQIKMIELRFPCPEKEKSWLVSLTEKSMAQIVDCANL